ncbi:unnamed protein product [Prorocentrum cordatum]|uniref:Uncharacterized protein n=1 Tax=Prorocentrum cordatum TaxID=2364126 RepID=A0ABN9QLJ6_9DINO|nr:unnamed protein product [Polarella glacialis]
MAAYAWSQLACDAAALAVQLLPVFAAARGRGALRGAASTAATVQVGLQTLFGAIVFTAFFMKSGSSFMECASTDCGPLWRELDLESRHLRLVLFVLANYAVAATAAFLATAAPGGGKKHHLVRTAAGVNARRVMPASGFETPARPWLMLVLVSQAMEPAFNSMFVFLAVSELYWEGCPTFLMPLGALLQLAVQKLYRRAGFGAPPQAEEAARGEEDEDAEDEDERDKYKQKRGGGAKKRK